MEKIVRYLRLNIALILVFYVILIGWISSRPVDQRTLITNNIELRISAMVAPDTKYSVAGVVRPAQEVLNGLDRSVEKTVVDANSVSKLFVFSAPLIAVFILLWKCIEVLICLRKSDEKDSQRKMLKIVDMTNRPKR